MKKIMSVQHNQSFTHNLLSHGSLQGVLKSLDNLKEDRFRER
jgi:hypothetical protein